MTNIMDVQYLVGRQVRKIKGYPFPGEIRSIYFTRKGNIRVVVECTVPEVDGCQHIFSPMQLHLQGETQTLAEHLRYYED